MQGRSHGSLLYPQSPALCRVSFVLFGSLQEWFDDRLSPLTGVGFQPMRLRYGYELCRDSTFGTREAYMGWLNVYKALGDYIAVLERKTIHFPIRWSNVDGAVARFFIHFAFLN